MTLNLDSQSKKLLSQMSTEWDCLDSYAMHCENFANRRKVKTKEDFAQIGTKLEDRLEEDFDKA